MSQKTDFPPSLTSTGEEPPNPKTIQAVKDIFQHLGKTVSALKLFPDNHESVVYFRQTFLSLLQAFFKDHDELEVEIQQSGFRSGGTVIFSDDNILRSLPYLLFKEGMKSLTFLKGISSAELVDFLQIIKSISLLPLEASDIVDAMWQREFDRIRFYAPDDYLESKVPMNQKIPLQFQVRKDDLFRGRIDLQAEDVADMVKAVRDQSKSDPASEAEFAEKFAALDEPDLRRLESLLGTERRGSEGNDFLDLAFELLFIEDRPEVFDGILKYLERHHAASIQILDFEHGSQLLRKLDQLSEKLAGASPAKIKTVDLFRRDLRDKSPWDEIRKAAAEERIPSPERLFEYLTLMGPQALPLGTHLYEDSNNAKFRSLALGFLEEIGRKEPQRLAMQSREDRPVITKVIIGIFDRMRDPRTIPFLAAFSNFKDKSVRLRSIQVLGGFAEDHAYRILVKALEDEDEDVRIEAANHIRIGRDPALIRDMIQLASNKKFLKKSAAEKTAVLLALGKSQSDDVCPFLRGLLRKSALFGRANLRAAQLGAVRALEAHAGSAAIEALESASRRGPKKIRAACREALEHIAHGKTASAEKVP